MTPSISVLNPPASSRTSILALKLNPEVLLQLHTLKKSDASAKLIVKDGKFLIKISDQLTFPCSANQETLRFDVYSPAPSTDSLDFTGTVTTRLNVISDPKQIKEHMKHLSTEHAGSPTKTHNPTVTQTATGPPAEKKLSWLLSPSPYAVTASDSEAVILTKFLTLLALGPITRLSLEQKLDPKHIIPRPDLSHLYNAHTQEYLSSDTLIGADTYPIIALGVTKADNGQPHIILKDKAYKELRLGQWANYTDFERGLVLENANNALSRLGYLETHPLRNRIAETNISAAPPKKHTGLGGGLLATGKRSASNHNSPNLQSGTAAVLPSPASPLSLAAKPSRVGTDLPELDHTRKMYTKKLRAAGSPVKDSYKSKIVLSLSLSAPSSEDERANKRLKTNSSLLNSNCGSSTTHSLPGHGSPALLVNDDTAHAERSADEVKLLSITRHAGLSLPRPSSAASTTEKKHQYYAQLAAKFRTKYSDYESLYQQLHKGHKKGTLAEKKKQLMRLFEMHNSLAEWKKKLWDYHNDNHLTEGIMHLSKHRKHPSVSNSTTASPAPGSVAVKGGKAQSADPAVVSGDRFPGSKPQFMKKIPATSKPRPKVALNY